MPLTQERLKELLHYDPETGIFKWKFRDNVRANWNTRYAGTVAGCLDHYGHTVTSIDDVKYRASRLAWLYVTGEWPENEVDHWDLDKSNNRFHNLREASHGQNAHNRPKPSTNTSGFKGASLHKPTQKWMAQIRADGRGYYLGLHDTPEAAHAAYCEAARKFHGEFARTE